MKEGQGCAIIIPVFWIPDLLLAEIKQMYSNSLSFHSFIRALETRMKWKIGKLLLHGIIKKRFIQIRSTYPSYRLNRKKWNRVDLCP